MTTKRRNDYLPRPFVITTSLKLKRSKGIDHRTCIHKLQFQPIVGDDYQSGVCTLPRQHWPSQSVQSMSMTMSPPMLYTGLGVVTRTCPSTTLLTKDVEARIPAQCCIQSQKDGKMSTPIVMAKRESSVWHFCRSRTSHVWTIESHRLDVFSNLSVPIPVMIHVVATIGLDGCGWKIRKKEEFLSNDLPFLGFDYKIRMFSRV